MGSQPRDVLWHELLRLDVCAHTKCEDCGDAHDPATEGAQPACAGAAMTLQLTMDSVARAWLVSSGALSEDGLRCGSCVDRRNKLEGRQPHHGVGARVGRNRRQPYAPIHRFRQNGAIRFAIVPLRRASRSAVIASCWPSAKRESGYPGSRTAHVPLRLLGPGYALRAFRDVRSSVRPPLTPTLSPRRAGRGGVRRSTGSGGGDKVRGS